MEKRISKILLELQCAIPLSLRNSYRNDCSLFEGGLYSTRIERYNLNNLILNMNKYLNSMKKSEKTLVTMKNEEVKSLQLKTYRIPKQLIPGQWKWRNYLLCEDDGDGTGIKVVMGQDI